MVFKATLCPCNISFNWISLKITSDFHAIKKGTELNQVCVQQSYDQAFRVFGIFHGDYLS